MKYKCELINGYLKLNEFCQKATRNNYKIVGITQSTKTDIYTVIYCEELFY